MREHGVELILAGRREIPLSQEWRRQGGETVQLNLPMSRQIRKEDGRISTPAALRIAATMPATVSGIARVVRSSKADAIHTNSHWIHLDGAVASRLIRVPDFAFLHDEARPGFGSAMRSTAVRLATRGVAVSQGVTTNLSDAARARTAVIPNGIDIERFSPGPADPQVRQRLGARPDDVLVLAACRLDPVKRIEDIIEAVARSARPRIHLAIAGSTTIHPEYAEKVRAIGRERLADRVTFVDSQDDMVSAMRAADVLLHAGIAEGMPLALIEAGACGRPVVAYSVSGVPEAVIDGVTGLLAPARDIDQLAARLGELVDSTELRERLGGAARAHVEAAHDIRKQAAAYADLLHSVCDTKANLDA